MEKKAKFRVGQWVITDHGKYKIDSKSLGFHGWQYKLKGISGLWSEHQLKKFKKE